MPWFDCFDERFPYLEILKDEPMSRHTTFHIGGPVKRFVRPAKTSELAELLDAADAEGWPVLLLGNGSNLLVSDQGIDALAIHTGRLDSVERAENTLLAEAGISLARLASFAQKEELSGLEFAHGIPGSLGGAVCMNAGAYGGEMSQALRSVTAWFPGRGVVTLDRSKLEFGYRRSIFTQRGGTVLNAVLELTEGDGKQIKAQMDDLNRRRREKQPLEFPSAGSTFKRPEGHFAGALIEQCGLKGTQVGGAQVSEKHAGFVINTGGASCDDVLRLIELIRQTVKKQTGVELEPEVRIV